MPRPEQTETESNRTPQAKWAQQWNEDRDMWLLQPNDRELGVGVSDAARTIAGALRAPSLIDRVKIATAKGDKVWLAIGVMLLSAVIYAVITIQTTGTYADIIGAAMLNGRFIGSIVGAWVVITAAVVMLREYHGPVRGSDSLSVVVATDGRQPRIAYHAQTNTKSVIKAIGDAYDDAADLHRERLSYAGLTGVPAGLLVEREGQVGKVRMDERKPTDVLCKGTITEDLIRSGEQHLPLGTIVETVAKSSVPMLVEITVTPQYAGGHVETRAKRADKRINAWPALVLHWIVDKINDGSDTGSRDEFKESRAKAIDETNPETLFDINVRFWVGDGTWCPNLAPALIPALNDRVTPTQQTATLPADPSRWHRYAASLDGIRHKPMNPYAARRQIASQAATATPPTRLLRVTGLGVYRDNYTVDSEEVLSLVLAPTDDEGLNRQLAVRPPAERPGPGPNDRRQEDLRGREP